MKQDVIVSLAVPASRGIAVLKELTQDLAQGSDIFKISSIYQVSRKVENHESIRKLRNNDWSQSIEVVIWFKSSLNALLWVEKIKKSEEKHSMRSLNQNVQCHLLFYGADTTMTPQLTLPYPELHRRSVTLELIAEIWPDKIHPILKKTVYELSQSAKEKELGEFFSTGSQLLDTTNPT
jgi:7,8-dihydro-6-hydroxymethylpterin-pyrophosphokinase